jgi:hypothetical protein
MRQAGISPPSEYVVSPKGLIKRVAYAQNIGGLVKRDEYRDGSGRITFGAPYIAKHKERQGWVFLKDLYAADPDPEISADGYQHWEAHAKMLERRAHGAYEMKDRTSGKTERLFAQQFPVDWLPAEVIARREGKSDYTGATYTAPPSRSKPKAKSGKTQHKASP